MTLTDLCEVTRNWFDVSRHIGKFKIENGTIDCDFLREGQFFRIIGSAFNDGVVYCTDGNKLFYIQGTKDGNIDWIEISQEETFDGAVWALAIPPNFIALYIKMCEWENENAEAINSPYSSESFGGYSYSKGTSGGEGLSWKTAFKKELERWQKI